jgi:hypothetical protein
VERGLHRHGNILSGATSCFPSAIAVVAFQRGVKSCTEGEGTAFPTFSKKPNISLQPSYPTQTGMQSFDAAPAHAPTVDRARMLDRTWAYLRRNSPRSIFKGPTSSLLVSVPNMDCNSDCIFFSVSGPWTCLGGFRRAAVGIKDTGGPDGSLTPFDERVRVLRRKVERERGPLQCFLKLAFATAIWLADAIVLQGFRTGFGHIGGTPPNGARDSCLVFRSPRALSRAHEGA